MKTLICRHCSQKHDLFYFVNQSGNKHLVYICTSKGYKTWVYAHFIPDLDIPEVWSKNKTQAEEDKQRLVFKNQLSLF